MEGHDVAVLERLQHMDLCCRNGTVAAGGV